MGKLIKPTTIIFLDQNILINIKEYGDIKNFKCSKTDKSKILKYDKYRNFISIMAANLELANNKFEQGEYLNHIESYSNAVSKFFKYAKTDALFFKDLKEYLTIFYSNYDLSNIPKYVELINVFNSSLVEEIPKKERFIKAEEIIKKTKNLELSISNIVTLSLIAVVYKNQILKKIFKFSKNKKFNPYNSLNDLLFLERSFYLFQIVKNSSFLNIIDYKILTCDKNLLKANNFFKFKSLKIDSEKETFSINLDIDKKLFTEIDENEFTKLKTLITSCQV